MIPRTAIVAIANAVEHAGGDMDDVRDLAAVWERIHADKHGRQARLAHDAANPACHCHDGGQPGNSDRCDRCHGYPTATARGARP